MQLYGKKNKKRSAAFYWLSTFFLRSGILPAKMREWYCLHDMSKANVSALCLKL